MLSTYFKHTCNKISEKKNSSIIKSKHLKWMRFHGRKIQPQKLFKNYQTAQKCCPVQNVYPGRTFKLWLLQNCQPKKLTVVRVLWFSASGELPSSNTLTKSCLKISNVTKPDEHFPQIINPLRLKMSLRTRAYYEQH